VADYYLVKLARGAAWDHSRPRRNQAEWNEHAAFMDALVEEASSFSAGPSAKATARTSCSSSTSRARRRSAHASAA
jgi:hypothetical protein